MWFSGIIKVDNKTQPAAAANVIISLPKNIKQSENLHFVPSKNTSEDNLEE